MSQRQQVRAQRARRRSGASALPGVWVRCFGLLFGLLFSVVTTAQAAHIHRPTKPDHRLQAPAAGTQNADDEEHCPLCVAMHPALPVATAVAPLPVVDSVLVHAPVREVSAAGAWSFARFGRPPPVAL